MNTVITEKVDGIGVIRGFGKLAIEPIKTRKVVAKEIKKTAEYSEAMDKRGKIKTALDMANEEGKKVKAAKGDIAKQEKHFADKLVRLEQAKGYEKELKALLPSLKKKEKELRAEHAVYFEPKAGEYAKTEAEISSLRGVLDGLNGKGYVDLAGNVVKDNRGVIYCQESGGKWAVMKVVTLGVGIPVDATMYDDLTPDQKKAVDLQIEIDRAAGMSAQERTASKLAAETRALNDAAFLRSKLEIQGATDALEQSQAFYQARMDELELIYG